MTKRNPPSEYPDIMTLLMIGGAAYVAYLYFTSSSTTTNAAAAIQTLTQPPVPVYSAPVITYNPSPVTGNDTSATAAGAGVYPVGADGQTIIDQYATGNPANGVPYASVAYAAYDPSFASLAAGAVFLASTWNQYRQMYGQQHSDPSVPLLNTSAASGGNPLATAIEYHSWLVQQNVEEVTPGNSTNLSGIVGLFR